MVGASLNRRLLKILGKSEKMTEKNLGEGVESPQVIREIVSALKVLVPDMPDYVLEGMVIARLAYTLCAMRVHFQETKYSTPKYCNLYFSVFVPSGKGKDRAFDRLADFVFEPFKKFQNENEKKYLDWKRLDLFRHFKEKYNINDIEEKIKILEKEGEESKELDRLYKKRDDFIKDVEKKIEDIIAREERFNGDTSCSAGTAEGLYSTMAGFADRQTGAVLIKQSEAGIAFNSTDGRKQQYIDTLYQGYDNRIEGRTLKNEAYGEITDVPLCCILMSSLDIMKKNSDFRLRQKTGLGRRLWVLADTDEQIIEDKAFLKETEEAEFKLKEIGKRLFGDPNDPNINFILRPIMDKNRDPLNKSEGLDRYALFTLEEGLYDGAMRDFEIRMKRRENLEKDEILKLSIHEYGMRALKLSTIYACLNHPHRLQIERKDYEQACNTVERLDCLSIFNSYQPKENDPISCIVEYLLTAIKNNNDEPLTYKKSPFYNVVKEALNGKFRTANKIKRDLLSPDNFDRTKYIIDEELQTQGYMLQATTGNTNGLNITISKKPETETTEADLKEIGADLL